MPTTHSFPSQAHELERIERLRKYRILDTLPEQEYDDLVHIASQICGTTMGLVSLVDSDRQWFKAKAGFDVNETPREYSFCAHAIKQPDSVMVVKDSERDERFATNPYVVDGPRIRFYAGAPLVTPQGHAMGTLCVMDRKPRDLSEEQQNALAALARQVMKLLETRRMAEQLEEQAAELQARDDRFLAFMNNSPAVAFLKDEAGRYLYVNEPFAQRFQIPPEVCIGKTDHELWAPLQADRIRKNDIEVMALGRTLVVEEEAIEANGRFSHWLSHKFPVQASNGLRLLGGMSLEITERKMAEQERDRLITELQAALKEVHMLSGLLPICASCKNIRDDAGYWQQLEDYFKSHTELRFTHSCCPACFEKLYGNLIKTRAASAKTEPHRR